MVFEDKALECQSCGGKFMFSSGEQKFFNERSLVNDPVRCPSCRATRRRYKAGVGETVRQMHPIVCNQCGINTEVPFQPKLNMPVYCKTCFVVTQS